MNERLMYYAGAALPSALLFSIGVGAVCAGLRRLGRSITMSWGRIVLLVWACFVAWGFLFGTLAVPTGAALVVFLLSLLFWVTTLLTGRRRSQLGEE